MVVGWIQEALSKSEYLDKVSTVLTVDGED